MNTIGRAFLSDDGKYRYSLERAWAQLPRYVLWIMLNPSTADAELDDATIRRCLGYSRAWGYTGILVGNLYAWRATKPTDLTAEYFRKIREPGPEQNYSYDAGHIARDHVVGVENDTHLRGLIRRASLVVCAWGQCGPLESRRWDVMNVLKDAKAIAHVLKFNQPPPSRSQREPSHPLRLAKDLGAQVWDMFPDNGPGAGS